MAITHMRQGDVLFTVDAKKTLNHIVISTAQRTGAPFHGGHANSVHVAIATGNGFEVIESVGGGLRRQALTPGNYRSYCYRGPNQDDIRMFAAEVAESFLSQRDLSPGFGAYNLRKATRSPFRLRGGHNQSNAHTQQFGQGAKAHSRFFCSNFVWRCYMAAAELVGMNQLPIPDSHSQLSPRDIEALFIRSTIWHARNGGHSMQHP